LFVAINILYGLIAPPIAEVSAYNTWFPGLKRMPFGGGRNPFTVELNNVDAMFASHEVSAGKAPDEIRVVLIGDSSIWGDGLDIQDTLSEQWNDLAPQCDGRTVRIYNLGYPHPSILKDILFMDDVMDKQPDLIVWFVTLNTLMNQDRANPFMVENRARVLDMVETYSIPYFGRNVLYDMEEGFYQRTLIGQRSFLARWLKLQALGLVWSATGRDIPDVPHQPVLVPVDVKSDPTYRNLEPGTDLNRWLLLEALSAGSDLVGETPLLLVNEPVYIASGMNSDVRYNALYPRWAYDQYREIVSVQAKNFSWHYLDLWDAIPPEYFTDPALHLNVEGERLLAGLVDTLALSMICK